MVTWCPTKKLGPIGSAVLTFIGYKQTDRQAKYINRWFHSENTEISNLDNFFSRFLFFFFVMHPVNFLIYSLHCIIALSSSEVSIYKSCKSGELGRTAGMLLPWFWDSKLSEKIVKIAIDDKTKVIGGNDKRTLGNAGFRDI